MHYGTAWYPEQRPPETWGEDLDRMRSLGMTVVRLAEFAWSRLQPTEAVWDFAWLDRAVEMAAERDLAVVLGTPTAAPPEWLTRAHPEVLRVEADGAVHGHGSRYHYDFTSPTYRDYCARIAEAMARRYGSSEAVIGWQIDNEYTLVSHGASTRAAFQAWLEKRFGTVEALNEAWGLDFWSQRYSGFAGIPVPDEAAHPSLRLAFKRFVSEGFAGYQRVQLEAIRRHAGADQWITHNFMEWFLAYDPHTVGRELDLLSYDKYVGSGHLDTVHAGSGYDLIRGIKGKPFWLMETQPGNVNWAGVNNALAPGETRLLAWHAVAHGAGAVLFWQWRTGRGGQEQYHGSLLHSGGQPRAIYEEARRLGAELERLGPEIDDARRDYPVAFLNDYDSLWALGFQPHHRDYDPVRLFKDFHRAFGRHAPGTDVIAASDNLDGYRIVVAPTLFLHDEALCRRLHAFVEAGGTLVLGPRSGGRNRENVWLDALPPGGLRGLAGLEVVEGFALECPISLDSVEGGARGQATVWAEWIRLLDEAVEPLLRFGKEDGWLEGRAAVTRHGVGRGIVYYLGCWPDEGTLMRLAGGIADRAGVSNPLGQLPAALSQRTLQSEAGPLHFVFNPSADRVSLDLPEEFVDLLSGDAAIHEIELEPWGLALLRPRS